MLVAIQRGQMGTAGGDGGRRSPERGTDMRERMALLLGRREKNEMTASMSRWMGSPPKLPSLPADPTALVLGAQRRKSGRRCAFSLSPSAPITGPGSGAVESESENIVVTFL